MKQPAEIGLVGLGVMGRNLALNLAGKGFAVAAYDLAADARAATQAAASGRTLTVANDIAALVASLARPRALLLMIPAGAPVDDQLAALAPLLERGDIVIDGGNSHYRDTARREAAMAAQGIAYLGMGVSGGEEGALAGPALMVGGARAGYTHVAKLLTSIAARAGDEACCDFVGAGGAGHFVKMVHNGIEYADMQLIAEAHFILSRGLKLADLEIGALFAEWNDGPLNSYLLRITSEVLRLKDTDTGRPVLDIIEDRAGQKGTGQWTSTAALELGVAAPTIVEAVLARGLSARKDERVAAGAVFGKDAAEATHDDALIRALREALYAARICVYSQGLSLIHAAGGEFGWDIAPATVAKIWRAGSILAGAILADIRSATAAAPAGTPLILAEPFRERIAMALPSWRRVAAAAVTHGWPAPCLLSALAWFDGLRHERGTAALIQAQRDRFGAHGFARVDRAGTFHLPKPAAREKSR
jgi:6-phosphogluconate dehydrogenase